MEPSDQASNEQSVVADPSVAVAQQAGGDVVELQPPNARRQRQRRTGLPLLLFALTCLSTFFVGTTSWMPNEYLTPWAGEGLMPLRRMLLTHWQDGLVYMAAVLAILLVHEMGHFIATVLHGIPSSLPYFIPFPITPLGTMGAVIGMDGTRADRRQIFDIGLAGPLAGLFVAVPLVVVGTAQLDLSQNQLGAFRVDLPLLVRWLMTYIQTPGYEPGALVWQGQLNPLFMAGWVGLFVTGLNMLPVSQLDGGHVIYTLFGKKSHWIAQAFMFAAIATMFFRQSLEWALMIGLILFIGTNHPPTRDDTVPLGWFRVTLGYLSLLVPIFCFPLRVIVQ